MVNFIIYPDPIVVTRPITHGKSKDTQTVKPTWCEDDSESGFTFIYKEPIWGGRVTSKAVWDNIRGKYTRRFKNGRVVEWTDVDSATNLYQKRVNLKIKGIQLSMDWDTINSFCRKCPEIEITTVNGREYWPLEESNLTLLVTRKNCQCAEFIFMRESGIDKRSKNCRHMKLLTANKKHIACEICCVEETSVDPTTGSDVEFFQYCERKNCDHLICNACYESFQVNKIASCPYCRKDF